MSLTWVDWAEAWDRSLGQPLVPDADETCYVEIVAVPDPKPGTEAWDSHKFRTRLTALVPLSLRRLTRSLLLAPIALPPTPPLLQSLPCPRRHLCAQGRMRRKYAVIAMQMPAWRRGGGMKLSQPVE